MEVVVPALVPEPWFSDPIAWSSGPTPHLPWLELNCKDGTAYPVEWRALRAHPLAVEFEHVRATIGGFMGRPTPIHIGSGYRTESWNARIKGSRGSRHIQGIAIDLWTPKAIGLLDFLDIVLIVAKRPGGRIRGIGVYPWGIHIDIREGGRIARWKGSRVSPEVSSRLMHETLPAV